MSSDIPEGWVTRQLGDLADVSWGDTKTTKASYVDEGFRAFSAAGPDGFLPYYDYQQDGVVLSAIGANCGKVYFATGRWSCIKNTIRFWGRNSMADSRFLYYATSVPEIWPIRGSAQPFIAQSDARHIELNIPADLKEQRAIAYILGSLDDKIESNRRIAELLEETVATVFRARFVDFVGVEELEESEIGPIPRGWKADPIGDVVTIVGGSTPSTKEPRYWEDGTYCWATPKDLSGNSLPVLLDTNRHINQAGLTRISSGLLPKGTVLLSSRAPVGYTAISMVETAINQGFIAMSPNHLLPSGYLLLWLRTNMEQIKAAAGGTTFSEISKRQFRPLPILVPDQGELTRFDEFSRPAYGLIAASMREGQTLGALRDTLLPKLISGEIRVTDTSDPEEVIGPATEQLTKTTT